MFALYCFSKIFSQNSFSNICSIYFFQMYFLKTLSHIFLLNFSFPDTFPKIFSQIVLCKILSQILLRKILFKTIFSKTLFKMFLFKQRNTLHFFLLFVQCFDWFSQALMSYDISCYFCNISAPPSSHKILKMFILDDTQFQWRAITPL